MYTLMKKQLVYLVLALAGLTLSLHSQNRVVLIEQFSNSSCPPCAAVSPAVYAYANNNSANVAVIAYHTQFPYNNDSMYFENPVEATQRVNYYTVNSVPSSILDGNVYQGSTNPFVGNMANFVNARLNVQARYEINLKSLDLNGNQLSGQIKFVSTNTANATETLLAQVVVIEKNVLKSSYAASPGANSETEYGYVMRKMIPDASGTALVNTSLNGADSLTFSWTLQHIKNRDELRVVVFVQNVTTKEVYQAQIFSVNNQPVGVSEQQPGDVQALVYPNPLHNGQLTIAFGEMKSVVSVSFINQWGAPQKVLPLNVLTKTVTINPDLRAGIYVVKIETREGDIIRKLIVEE